jgi:hypothetical protein
MDQPLSLSRQISPSSPRSVQTGTATVPPELPAAEEEPESPGRSPRQLHASAAGPDPLAEGLAFVAGMALALITLLVPLATVVHDVQPPQSSATVRAGW